MTINKCSFNIQDPPKQNIHLLIRQLFNEYITSEYFPNRIPFENYFDLVQKMILWQLLEKDRYKNK